MADFNAREYDREHIKNLLGSQQMVLNLLDDATRQVIEQIFIADILEDIENGDEFFTFADYPRLMNNVTDIMERTHSGMTNTISAGNTLAWGLSNTKNDAMLDWLLQHTEKKISSDFLDAWYNHNNEALAAFINRVEGGMDLSGRVWKITEDFYDQLQLAVDVSIGTGKSAARMSQDVRNLLIEPNKLFRRVRNKHGLLVPSKAMRNYHPGQGVYRSSYKNALRLTGTENNIAYRTADHNRWSKMKFVEGITIQMSNNHPVYDICDTLAGDYSKDFKFVGWHPHCRCFAVAKLPDVDEFERYLDSIEDGTDEDFDFSGTVEGVPSNFTQWVDDNEEKLKSAYRHPYFIMDNQRFINADIYSTSSYDSISKCEKDLRRQKRFEVGVCFNSKGKALFTQKGDVSTVHYDKRQMELMKNNVLVHNHPSVNDENDKYEVLFGHSISIGDVIMASVNNLKETRVVAGSYTYAIKRPENGWPSVDDIHDAFKKSSIHVAKEYNGGRFYNALFSHLNMKYAARILGLNYERIKA